MNLQQASRVLEARLEHRMRTEAELSMPEYELLFRLKMAPDHPLLMGEIAELLINSPSGATRIADRLEKDGLITRETPRDNRRVVQVTLTKRGQHVLEKADQVFRDALRESFAGHLTDSDLDDLRRLMRKLLEGNGAWQDARCSPALEPRATS
ncbi:MAG TPA: MarR family transcriptional regulator [Candidatus Dormibacteraeota bacterium]|nr:MarR family transcriptional regulator [Candidatus Dormibacteraeota bacterium]